MMLTGFCAVQTVLLFFYVHSGTLAYQHLCPESKKIIKVRQIRVSQQVKEHVQDVPQLE